MEIKKCSEVQVYDLMRLDMFDDFICYASS
jgi:hypothetical protein